jgi:hypothetical protein
MHRVVTARRREIRVAYTRTHPDAITEATRRLRMSHNLWPDEPWRYHIKREHDPLRHRYVWVLYAITPKGTWT